MASTILADNGVSSGSAGIKTTADSTGALALQTTTAGGAATTAVTIDTSQNVGIGTSSPVSQLHLVSAAESGMTIYKSAVGAGNVRVVSQGGGSALAFGSDQSTGTTERMRIDSSGNVGIGTSSPSSGLVPGLVIGNGTDNKGITLWGTTTTQQNIAFTDTASAQQGLIQYDHSGDYMRFFTNTLERARIDSSGNLLWNKTTASETNTGIQLGSDGTNVSRLSIGGANSSSATGVSIYSTTAGAFRFYVSYGGQISATSTSIAAISDESLKENIVDLETGIAEVMALRPRRFDWKEETQLTGKGVAGFIAQEVESVLPELVYDYQYNETETKKSIKMGDILPTLVKAIQEQQALINNLTERLAALEAK